MADTILERPVSGAPGPGWLRRASWGAIFAGTVVTVGTQITLALLGASIGLAAFNPEGGINAGGLTVGTGIWLIITGIVSLFFGGWITGRLSGEPYAVDRALNGLTMWGLVIIITLYLMAVTASTVIGGALGILRAGATAAGQVIGATGSGAAKAAEALGIQDTALDALQNQVQQLLRQSARELNTPQERQMLQDDINKVGAAITDFIRTGRISPDNRRELVTILSRRTQMNQTQADSTINDWTAKLGDIRSTVQQQAERAAQVAEDAASAGARAALWLFIILLLDGVAAVLGSMWASGGREAGHVR